MKKILKNKARCLKCGDIIESKSLNDFQICSCGALTIDGGLFYLRRVFQQGLAGNMYEELSEWEDVNDPVSM